MEILFFTLFTLLLNFSLLNKSWAEDLKLEAEDDALSGVNIATFRAGFSGTGYVTGFDNSNDNIRNSFNNIIKQFVRL